MRTSLHYETAAGGADREMRWQFLLWKLHKIAASSVQSPPKKKMSKSNNNKFNSMKQTEVWRAWERRYAGADIMVILPNGGSRIRIYTYNR